MGTLAGSRRRGSGPRAARARADGGFGAHSVPECVGLEQSMLTALSIALSGGDE